MNILKAILIAYFVGSALLGIYRVLAVEARRRRAASLMGRPTPASMPGATAVGIAIGLAINAALVLAVIYA